MVLSTYKIVMGSVNVKERLLELRKFFGMSQREFGEKIGMTQSTYSPLENGREIRESYIKLICNTYRVSEAWFRHGTPPIFIDDRYKELDELLTIYDDLSPALRKFLLKQAGILLEFKDNMK